MVSPAIQHGTRALTLVRCVVRHPPLAQAGAEAGLPFPQWYEAGYQSLQNGNTPALPAVDMTFGEPLVRGLHAAS